MIFWNILTKVVPTCRLFVIILHLLSLSFFLGWLQKCLIQSVVFKLFFVTGFWKYFHDVYLFYFKDKKYSKCLKVFILCPVTRHSKCFNYAWLQGPGTLKIGKQHTDLNVSYLRNFQQFRYDTSPFLCFFNGILCDEGEGALFLNSKKIYTRFWNSKIIFPFKHKDSKALIFEQ